MQRTEVERTYNVTSFNVPSHRTNLRQVSPPLLSRDKEDHYESIFKEVQEVMQAQRPLLILCETIQSSFDLAEFFQKRRLSFQLFNALQAENEGFIIRKAGQPSVITIATNTAGRGTDIILSPLSKQNGGLHVILSFFPENDRFENQAFGRCARQGDPGSCRLIIQTDQSLSALLSERAEKVKKASSDRLARVQIEKEHDYFLSLFCQQLQQLYDSPLEKFSKTVITTWLEKS